jgi:hypothetical protein
VGGRGEQEDVKIRISFQLDKREGRYLLRNLIVDWKITLNLILKQTRCQNMYWILLAQDRVRWRDLANRKINLLLL